MLLCKKRKEETEKTKFWEYKVENKLFSTNDYVEYRFERKYNQED